jgi:hypothetical protein
MRNENFHELPKSLKVYSAARHLAQSFKVLFDSCIPCPDFRLRIYYTGFSVMPLSLELKNTYVFLT